MITNVYIDGFNLYYGSLKNTPFRWLDLLALCTQLLPQDEIKRIRYFTAKVKGSLHDPQAPNRQDTYFRALKTIPNLSIHDEGRYVQHPICAPQYPLVYRNDYNKKQSVKPKMVDTPDICAYITDGSSKPGRPPNNVYVLKTEEKGSDVNLATFLLTDCFEDDYEQAVVVSNDSDLVLPVKIVANKFSKPVIVINPHHKSRQSSYLREAATEAFQTINKKVLALSQFPDKMSDDKGEFSKPPRWES